MARILVCDDAGTPVVEVRVHLDLDGDVATAECRCCRSWDLRRSDAFTRDEAVAAAVAHVNVCHNPAGAAGSGLSLLPCP